MAEPTVGDVYEGALPKIKAMRERHFREDVIYEYTHANPFSYLCWRCRKRHWINSKIGQAHLPANRGPRT